MIETARLHLIPAELQHFAAFERGGEAELAKLLKVEIIDSWLVFPEAISYSHRILQSDSASLGWWMYFLVDKTSQTLIGNGGYKGAPDTDGAVEIGYALAPSARGRGLATEAARGLTVHAFTFPGVKIVRANTLAETNASNNILQKIGMRFVGALNDPEDGELWQWSVTREEFQK